MRQRLRTPLLLAGISGVLAASPVLAQTAPAGIVTAVQGTAMIARAATNESGPLHFKDDVFLYDRITTGEQSLARILLGGNAVVTARERSVVTITAVPGRTTMELQNGRLLLAVAKGTVRPGESIDIKTRNAIIGIRGTVVMADFVPGKAADGSADATTFTILSGAVEVTPLDPLSARGVSPALRLGALQSIKVLGTRAPEVTPISREQGKRMTEGFTVPIRPSTEGANEVASAPASAAESTLGSSSSKGKDKESPKAVVPASTTSTVPAGNAAAPTSNSTGPTTNSSAPAAAIAAGGVVPVAAVAAGPAVSGAGSGGSEVSGKGKQPPAALKLKLSNSGPGGGSKKGESSK